MIELDKILANVKYDDIEYPVDQWQPEDCGLDGFRINRFGEWFFKGSSIKRQSLVILLSKLLRKEGDSYFVVSPVEKIRVDVDCLPFCVLLAEHNTQVDPSTWVLTLNTGAKVVLDEDHPLSLYFDSEFQLELPKIKIRPDLYASVNRNVYYQWIDFALSEGEQVGLSSNGTWYPLSSNEI